MTPSGIELATFRFVAQHLNCCATAVGQGQSIHIKFRIKFNLQTLLEKEVTGYSKEGVAVIRPKDSFLTSELYIKRKWLNS